MKTKKTHTAAPLLPAVREQAEAIRARGKTYRLPAAADMPPVEVIRLDGTRGQADRITQFAMMNQPRTWAWMRVFVALAGLAEDPEVLAHPAAAEFVRVVAEMARTAGQADTAAEALAPVDGLLPKGRLGVKSSTAHAAAAGALRKLADADIKSMRRTYADRVRSGEAYGAIKALERQFNVSGKTVRAHVADLIPKRIRK